MWFWWLITAACAVVLIGSVAIVAISLVELFDRDGADR